MSNNQWNTGQDSNEWAPQQGGQQEWGQAQPQASAQEWGQAQPQASAQDWNQQQPASNDWGQQPAQQDWGQAQAPQQDWGQAQPQASAQEWGGQAEPQASAQEWGQQQPQQQDWNQQQPQQDWNQQQPQQNWGQAGQHFPAQQFPGQPAQPKGGSLFDFSFKQPALPAAAGTIFLIGVIAVGLEWLFSFITILGSGGEFFAPGALSIINSLVGGLAAAVFKILVLRVLIEIGIAGTKLLKKSEEPKEEA